MKILREDFDSAVLLEEIENADYPRWMKDADEEHLGLKERVEEDWISCNQNEIGDVLHEWLEEAAKEVSSAKNCYLNEGYESKNIAPWIREAFEDSTSSSFSDFLDNWEKGVNQWQ